jgi:hypothetical protein
VISYSTFLGASRADFGLALAIDAAGNAYVEGSSSDPNFYDGAEGFITKLDANGSVVYTTSLGGLGIQHVWGVAVDSDRISLFT